MAKKPRNKRYVQRYSKTNLSPMFAFSENEVYQIKLPARVALNALRDGTGTMDHWIEMVARLTAGRELAINYFTDEAGEHIHSAVLSATDMFQDYEKNHVFAVTPEQSQLIEECLDIVDDMHEHLTRRDYHRVFNDVLIMKVENIVQMRLPWDEYLVQRANMLKSKGRKVTVDA